MPAGELVLAVLESGASFAAAARQFAREGYTGVEWACGIPGTLGGAAVYNAGAYDGSLADVLLAATLLDGDGSRRRLPAAGLRLAYRSSAILRDEMPDAIVLTVELVLRRSDALQFVILLDGARRSDPPLQFRRRRSRFRRHGARHIP